MKSRIRLLTHNVWNKDFNSPEWEQKGGDCSAAARVGGLLRVYRETAPDIIGGQEVSVKRFERYSPNYYFPVSDHSPAYIDMEF